ncbi:segregation and condensation protein A [Heliobacterium mobile]|nr:segregation/condensation protein A [Heliobacterium mobile]
MSSDMTKAGSAVTAYQVNLPVFEGPFDLLVHLIEKNKVNIYDIPIAQITAEYLAYLRQMEEIDLEVTSSFLLMAAQLLAIKARMLLPKPPKAPVDDDGEEAGEDPRQELVDKLLEYRKYKAVAELLRSREVEQIAVYGRVVDPSTMAHLFQEENPLEGVMLGDILAALRKVLNRQEKEEPVADIPREEISIQARMQELLEFIITRPKDDPVVFSSIFDERRRTGEVIVTFLAVLELVRMKKIRAIQRSPLGEIYLIEVPVL